MNPMDFLNLVNSATEIKLKEKEVLTFEDVCAPLNFYCGCNPKIKEDIEKRIKDGLPKLYEVSVKASNSKVTIKFKIEGDPTKQVHTYNYGFPLSKNLR
ncbi:MAG: hypothetical protein WCO35_00935 [Candidatus Nomurabacteria bacterium]